MNTQSLVREPNRKKLKRKNNSQLSSRSLNDFHDAILKHILSFLPTKFAAQTSVLSQRWQTMWTSLPNLDFKEVWSFGEEASRKRKRQRKHFMNFVERALILHNGSRIRKFSLRCQVKDDVSRIKTWISGAVSRNAQEFNLEFHSGYCEEPGNFVDMFPLCLFNCETMEVLKLKTRYGVQLPSQICLPRLKILRLKHITFKEYHPTDLLFASPALEQLFIEECIWEVESEIIISASKLWNLYIDESCDICDPVADTMSITITAPRLQYFNYYGPFLKVYRFPCSPSIIEANLTFSSESGPYDTPEHFDELFKSLQLVNHLTLPPHYVQSLSRAVALRLENLTYLETWGWELDLSCKELEMLVNKCPRLETLRFSQGIYFCPETYNFEHLLNLEFTYLPSTLKEIMIGDFSGEIKEIAFVQVLLAKLKSLETMKIDFGQKVHSTISEEIKTLLLALPRGSKSCKLIIDDRFV